MKIIICGAGLAGYDMARYLAQASHDVTIIDNTSAVTEKFANTLDVRCVLGNAAHPSVLAEADVGSADILVAMTANDEINMLACQVAHTLFGVKTTIARLREPSYTDPNWSDLFTERGLPIDVIVNVDSIIADIIATRLGVPDSFDALDYGEGSVKVVGLYLTEDCPVINTSLRHLTELFPTLEATVVGVERAGKVIVPRPDEELLQGDKIWLVAAQHSFARTLKVFGQEGHQPKHLVLLGAGRLSQAVARRFAEQKTSVTLVEENTDRAKAVSERLAKQQNVIAGSLFDVGVRESLNLTQDTEFLALTSDDNRNIMASLMMQREGCGRVLCAVNAAQFLSLGEMLGVQNIIAPRSITTSSILKHLRKGRIAGANAIADGQAEIVEGEVPAESQLSRKPLRELGLRKDSRIGAILREGKMIVPRGDVVLAEGDHLILFGLAVAQDAVTKLFAEAGDYA